MIRAINAEEPYWIRVIEYCVNGCLQSVLDEFVHFLLEAEGVAYGPAGEAVRKIADRIRGVLQLRTAILPLTQLGSIPKPKGLTSTARECGSALLRVTAQTRTTRVREACARTTCAHPSTHRFGHSCFAQRRLDKRGSTFIRTVTRSCSLELAEQPCGP